MKITIELNKKQAKQFERARKLLIIASEYDGDGDAFGDISDSALAHALLMCGLGHSFEDKGEEYVLPHIRNPNLMAFEW